MSWDDDQRKLREAADKGHAAQENQIDDGMIKGGAEWLIGQLKQLPPSEELWVVLQRTLDDHDRSASPTTWKVWGIMTRLQKNKFMHVVTELGSMKNFYAHKVERPFGIEGV